MAISILGLTFSFAVLDWLAVGRDWRRLEYFAKPAVMVALLAWLLVSAELRGPLVWFGLALIFSLAGDVFLMLPREQFIPGLVSFLLAHVAYIAGLNPTWPPVNLVSMLLLFGVGILAVLLYRRLGAGLEASGRANLKGPVLVYAAVISLMVLSALITLVRPEWQTQPAVLVSLGAGLFFISDSVLAWNKFSQPIPHGRLLVIVTYHLGQIALILGAVQHF